ncbi:inverse autotransporter beta domain-containing protein [Kiloniella laminariae]|uniref:Inverse autotransporter beta domain-containing protein n=1 Tax=Kiloniella laminariae TaxID=454162 RepID=A0ABT4LMU5_9PROT|nr:inverse autotransporter beta domain-containing protein [Kiloniella laminariae]MCZ4282408.1 inverse autotransporter beta domain-containing protein [Kiloniella laminariae]
MPAKHLLQRGAAHVALFLGITAYLPFTTISLSAEEVKEQQNVSTDKWGAHIEVEGKYGTDRHIGESILFVPLFQNEDSMVFLDLRGKLDNNQSREANVGLGYRQIVNEDWLVGGYGFYDRRHSPEGNDFNQMTFGAEALTENLDLRVNGYLPFGDTTKTSSKFDSVQLNGSSITMQEGQERALKGFDGEVGHTLPVLSLMPDKSDEMRVYLGGYHFWEEGVDNVTGPRVRAEYRMNDVFIEGSRISLNGELQHDSPRGRQGFVGLKFRIPLQPDTARGQSRLSRLEKRMTETVVRDVDVVAQAGAFGEEVPAIDMETGKALVDLNVIDAKTGSELKTGIETAEATKVAFVNSKGQVLNIDDTITLQAGQRVRGNFRVKHPTTGREMNFGNTSVHGTDATKHVFAMNDNSSLSGVVISGGYHGVHSSGKNNVTLSDIQISATREAGVNFEGGTNLKISRLDVSNLDFDNADGFSNANPNNTVTGVGLRIISSTGVEVDGYHADYLGTGILSNNVRDLKVTNSTISRTRKEGMVHHYLHDASFDNVEIDKTGADGAAFIVSADVSYRNSSLTNLGAMNKLGNYSGVNISGFSSDGTIIVGSTENKNYNFDNLKISNASNSGMMLQEIRDSSFNNIEISNVDIIGIQVMRMMRDVENLEFDNVQISNAQNAGFWMMGDVSDIQGDIRITDTATACGRSKWMAANLTQSGAQELRINGAVLAPVDVGTTCQEVSNF